VFVFTYACPFFTGEAIPSLCGKRTVNEITPQVIEELRKSMSDRKSATV
jgi:hypothetical protein